MLRGWLTVGLTGGLLFSFAPTVQAQDWNIRIEIVTPPAARAAPPASNDQGDPPPAADSPAAERPPAAAREREFFPRLGIASSGAPVYRQPNPRSQALADLAEGRYVSVEAEERGFYAIQMSDGGLAYVPASHVELLDYRVVTTRPAELPRVPGAGNGLTYGNGWQVSAPSTEIARVIEEAFRYVGVAYRWGGNDFGGVDCSGLVRNAFRSIGVNLPRRAIEQGRVGLRVPVDQLQAGDRLYFSHRSPYDHTGIYLGDGYFIHASSSRGRVLIEPLAQPFYERIYTEARR